VLASVGELEPRAGDEVVHGLETGISDAPASEVTGAPIETASPPTFPSIARHSPVWSPARSSIPSPATVSPIARAQRIARTGPSNAAKKPSPAVSSSRPR
jgi:hypothetical protein